MIGVCIEKNIAKVTCWPTDRQMGIELDGREPEECSTDTHGNPEKGIPSTGF